ncbi:hypothetical protein GCM10020258_31370 [Sphingomonas yabuuchiae]
MLIGFVVALQRHFGRGRNRVGEFVAQAGDLVIGQMAPMAGLVRRRIGFPVTAIASFSVSSYWTGMMIPVDQLPAPIG